MGRGDRYEAQDTPKFPHSMETTGQRRFPDLRSLSAPSAVLDKCVSRCGKPPSPLTPTAAAASTAHAVVSPSSKLPAHVVMTRSNFGDIARVRHGDRFDVCLLFSVIWELVSDRSSKFVFPDILAEKKTKKKKHPGTSQMLNGPKNLAAGNDDMKVLLFFPFCLVK